MFAAGGMPSLTAGGLAFIQGTATAAQIAALGAMPATGGTATTPIIAGDTWANRTNYQTAAGNLLRVTDIGVAGSIWIWDGTRWYPLNGVVTLLSTAIPMILPSSGSIGNNGALTGLTALPTTYTSCYMYFPVNVIAAGVAAGLYYVVMSSTTAGTIYNNTYTSGLPTIPASPTAFSTTGPGAYTQTTATDITLLSFTVPGNTMGINGRLEQVAYGSYTNSASTKLMRQKFGGTQFFQKSEAGGSSVTHCIYMPIANNSVTNSQVASSNGLAGFQISGTTQANRGTVDTTADQSLIVTGQLVSAATDFYVVEASRVELRA